VTGLDRVAQGYWPKRLAGKNVGLVTHHCGRMADGRLAAEILEAHPDIQLTALFSPEHGYLGVKDTKIASSVDLATGLKIHSLYGKTRKPTREMLKGLDVLVVDLQDIGTRFYTYLSTMVLVMEAATEAEITVVILDRPNPVGGVQCEGPLADVDSLDFVGIHPIPIRHGMTLGELAYLIREDKRLDLDLEVLWMRGWRRDMLFDATGQPWIDPSPNMRSLEAALIYPGLGLLETTNLSVGRGTDSPFEIMGAPWFPTEAVLAHLTAQGLPGVAFESVQFRPAASKHAGKVCRGLRINVVNRRTFRPVAMGLGLARALTECAPRDWNAEKLPRLFKSKETLELIRDALTKHPRAPVPPRFLVKRKRHLRYD